MSATRTMLLAVTLLALSGNGTAGAVQDVPAALTWQTTLRAAAGSQTELVRQPLNSGADPNMRDENSHPALMLAARAGHLEVVRLLLDNAADANAMSETGGTALMAAAINGHSDVASVLLENGADVHAAAQGRTPLMHATDGGHVDVVRLLLDHGADANMQTEDGTTALLLASRSGHSELVQILIEGRAFVEAVVDELPERRLCRPLRYPEHLRRAGIGGTVVIQAVVDTTGHIDRNLIGIIRSDHEGFETPAIELLMGCLFRSGRIGGQRVRVLIQQRINYRTYPG